MIRLKQIKQYTQTTRSIQFSRVDDRPLCLIYFSAFISAGIIC